MQDRKGQVFYEHIHSKTISIKDCFFTFRFEEMVQTCALILALKVQMKELRFTNVSKALEVEEESR